MLHFFATCNIHAHYVVVIETFIIGRLGLTYTCMREISYMYFFACVQPVISLLRPAPDHPRRSVWNWFHWSLGYVALFLSCEKLVLCSSGHFTMIYDTWSKAVFYSEADAIYCSHIGIQRWCVVKQLYIEYVSRCGHLHRLRHAEVASVYRKRWPDLGKTRRSRPDVHAPVGLDSATDQTTLQQRPKTRYMYLALV